MKLNCSGYLVLRALCVSRVPARVCEGGGVDPALRVDQDVPGAGHRVQHLVPGQRGQQPGHTLQRLKQGTLLVYLQRARHHIVVESMSL